MSIIVGILTHNAIANARLDLFEKTREQIASRAFPAHIVSILDNGSTDGTQEIIRACEGGNGVNRREYGKCYIPPDGNTSPGRGRNELIAYMNRHGYWDTFFENTVVVLSDDDVLWNDWAATPLWDFWKKAPEDVTIVSGLFEPDWPWNKPREVVRAGGVSVLIRDSAPAAAWTFRARHWKRIFPLVEEFGPGIVGEDIEACQRLRANGYRVGQLDLATHLGVGVSTHGNDPSQLGRPIDRKAWGLDP